MAMLTVAAEFTSRELKEENIDELRAWFNKHGVAIAESLLGVVFTLPDTRAINLAEELLFSRKFKGISTTLRPTKGV